MTAEPKNDVAAAVARQMEAILNHQTPDEVEERATVMISFAMRTLVEIYKVIEAGAQRNMLRGDTPLALGQYKLLGEHIRELRHYLHKSSEELRVWERRTHEKVALLRRNLRGRGPRQG